MFKLSCSYGQAFHTKYGRCTFITMSCSVFKVPHNVMRPWNGHYKCFPLNVYDFSSYRKLWCGCLFFCVKMAQVRFFDFHKQKWNSPGQKGLWTKVGHNKVTSWINNFWIGNKNNVSVNHIHLFVFFFFLCSFPFLKFYFYTLAVTSGKKSFFTWISYREPNMYFQFFKVKR